MPAGVLGPGDRVELLSTHSIERLARGPVAKDGDAPIARVRALPDELLRTCAGTPAPAPLAAARRRGLERLARLPAGPARGLATALLFGDRDELSGEITDLFTRTGTRHLLALSGLHVGLLGFLLALPLGRLLAAVWRTALQAVGRSSRVRARPLQALVVLCFIPLGGGSPPVARAAIGIALALVAPFVPGPSERAGPGHAGLAGHASRAGRRVDGLSLWSLALILECASDPRAPLRTGVQLSYAATLALITCHAALRTALVTRVPGGGRVGPRSASGRDRSPYWSVPLERGARLAWDAGAASVTAALATLPIVWSAFGEWAPVGVVATPVALVPLILFLVVVLLWVLAPALVAVQWIERCGDALLALLHAVDRLPLSPCPLPPRPWPLAALGAVALLSALGRSDAYRAARLRLGVACFGALALPWALAPQELELVALDVGHGSAVLVRAPGQGCVLFDAGSRDRLGLARSAIAPILRAWEVDSIDVVASHTDRDHTSALPWIVERWPVRVWAGAAPSRCGARVADDTIELDVDRGVLRLPARRRDARVRFDLVRGLPGRGNEGSRTLRVRDGDGVLLLCGDAEADGLLAMLESGALDGPLRLLLVPHHGSQSPFLGRLLDATRPLEAWASCAAPPPVEAEIGRRGVPFRCTARAGALILGRARGRGNTGGVGG